MQIRLAQKPQKANTLIEVVLATAILAIMGAGVVGSINYGLFIVRVARENQRATQILLERLESIRLYNWTQVTTSGFIPTSFTESYDPQSPTTPGITYYGSLGISNVNLGSSYSTNLRQFTVSLLWTNMGGVSHQRSVSTYVARDGMQNYVY
ncbi:MAG TPA: type II secretion system protein [Verrucomicrobiae bacterium]|nr:type II secretion system protein [Verrucomicrobiae bacterium]